MSSAPRHAVATAIEWRDDATEADADRVLSHAIAERAAGQLAALQRGGSGIICVRVETIGKVWSIAIAGRVWR